MASVNSGPSTSSTVNQAPGLSATWSDKTGAYLVKPDGTTVLVVPAGYTFNSTTNTFTITGNLATAQSSTAVAIANSGTVVTASIGVSRLAPAAAVTGIILAAGTIAGQQVTVINEAVAINTVTMAASGTSNVATGTGCVIAGLTAALFTWDTGTSLWYQS
jgi:hypothetical protein